MNAIPSSQPHLHQQGRCTEKQAPNYATVLATTSVDITYIISVLTVNLDKLQSKMHLKTLDVLTLKAWFAIMGTHSDWHLPPMTTELRTEIADYLQKGHSEGKWDKDVVFTNQSSPLFTLKLQKMKPPKSSEMTLAWEYEFLDHYHN